MKIGIDISQLAYPNTGVANYLSQLVDHLVKIDDSNEYILFYSSLRRKFQFSFIPSDIFRYSSGQGRVTGNFRSNQKKVKFKFFKFPPVLLELVWNRFHIIPIEWLIGDVDIFLSSDWTQPPTLKAKKATILYDLIVYKFPGESHDQVSLDAKKMQLRANIVASQKRRLHWVKKECDMIFCISESTKRDAMEILGIEERKLKVIYPGVT